MMRMSKVSKEQQHNNASVREIEYQKKMIAGYKNAIIQKLMISHGKPYVDEISDRIDYIIESSVLMGIELKRCKLGNRTKNNITIARAYRNN